MRVPNPSTNNLLAVTHSIYEKIGKGKHSTVYKGRKKKTIQYHAIKSVDKSQKPRVLQEVRCLCACVCCWHWRCEQEFESRGTSRQW